MDTEILDNAVNNDLTTIRSLVAAYKSEGPAYQDALQNVHEEFSDLERLISRKHDVILKGRLTDAIKAFMKKVESVHPELQTDETSQNAQGAAGDNQTFRRNKPGLNME